MASFWPSEVHDAQMMEHTLDVWEALSRWNYKGVATCLLSSRMHGETVFEGLGHRLQGCTDTEVVKFMAKCLVTTHLVSKDVYSSDLHGSNLFLLNDGSLGLCDIDLALLPKVMTALHARFEFAKERFGETESMAATPATIFASGYVSDECCYGSLYDFLRVLDSLRESASNLASSKATTALLMLVGIYCEYFQSSNCVNLVTGMAIVEIEDQLLQKLWGNAIRRGLSLGIIQNSEELLRECGFLFLGCECQVPVHFCGFMHGLCKSVWSCS